MVKLLFMGRCPPIEGPVPWPTPPLLVTPALNSDRLIAPYRKPEVSMIGRLTI
jgi:hypothetical protein